MSHKEEQIQEVEALESIFGEEIEIIETEPFHILQFDVNTEHYKSDPENEARLVLHFKFTENYPDEAPEMKIVESENIQDEDKIHEFVNSLASENLGMPMIYTLVCAIIEKINKDNEDRKTFEKDEKERLERQREEEELKRFEGTKVTVETFLKWKAAFDKEMKDLKKNNQETTNKKPTGKQLFERDENLFTSDLQYMNDDQVEVDEALFQDLDDLDIEDDGEEYKPGDDDDDDDEDYEDDEEEEEEE